GGKRKRPLCFTEGDEYRGTTSVYRDLSAAGLVGRARSPGRPLQSNACLRPPLLVFRRSRRHLGKVASVLPCSRFHRPRALWARGQDLWVPSQPLVLL